MRFIKYQYEHTPAPVATQRRLQPRLDFLTPRRRASDLLRNGTRRVLHSTHSQSPNNGPWKGGALHVACTAPSQTSHNRMRPPSSPPPHSRQGSIIAVTCVALSHPTASHNLIDANHAYMCSSKTYMHSPPSDSSSELAGRCLPSATSRLVLTLSHHTHRARRFPTCLPDADHGEA